MQRPVILAVGALVASLAALVLLLALRRYAPAETAPAPARQASA